MPDLVTYNRKRQATGFPEYNTVEVGSCLSSYLDTYLLRFRLMLCLCLPYLVSLDRIGEGILTLPTGR